MTCGPLPAACISAEVIRRSSDSATIQEFAVRIIDNAKRSDRMIQDLLNTVIFQTGEGLSLRIEQFDIYEVTKEINDQFIATLGERFQLTGHTVVGWVGPSDASA